jgi:uncharacterized protein YacL
VGLSSKTKALKNLTFFKIFDHMASEIEMSREEFLRGYYQTKKLAESMKKNDRWLYLSILGSFILIILLNYFFPDIIWVEKKPLYDANFGLIGLVLTFFGIIILTNVICIFKGSFLGWILLLAISILLIYFGFPLLLGFG